jgi:hypothetical protein
MTAANQELDIASLVDQMSLLLELPLHPDHRPGVIANLERTAAIAQRVLEFPIPDEIEAAPIFQP